MKTKDELIDELLDLAFAEDIGDGAGKAPLSPAEFATAAARWSDAGATIVGGCCGTTPAHVRALARWRTARAAAESD